MITVRSWGVGTSVVGPGHPGRAWLGASRGGAADLAALSLGNRLLGNPATASGLETSGGLVIRTDAPTMVAITGAVADVEVADGPPVGWGAPVVLPSGATLVVGRLRRGARVYVTVRGGLSRHGDALEVGPDPGNPASVEVAAPRPPADVVTIWPGPRADWFRTGAWELLVGSAYAVTAASNRVGVRLRGPVLERRIDGELPSEGLVEGAIQVPPDGQPIIMLADHPTTGGYPVIAVVDPSHITAVAQAAPGDLLRFAPGR